MAKMLSFKFPQHGARRMSGVRQKAKRLRSYYGLDDTAGNVIIESAGRVLGDYVLQNKLVGPHPGDNLDEVEASILEEVSII